MQDKVQTAADPSSNKRRMEIYAFLIVTAVLMPALEQIPVDFTHSQRA